jgi:hypothetical protein
MADLGDPAPISNTIFIPAPMMFIRAVKIRLPQTEEIARKRLFCGAAPSPALTPHLARIFQQNPTAAAGPGVLGFAAMTILDTAFK